MHGAQYSSLKNTGGKMLKQIFKIFFSLLILISCQNSPTSSEDVSENFLSSYKKEREVIICSYNEYSELELKRYFPQTFNGSFVNVFVWHIDEMHNIDVYGDEIGIFLPDKTCVGAVRVCRDGTTSEILGFSGDIDWNGEPIIIKYWDHSQNMEVNIRYKFECNYIWNCSGVYENSGVYLVRLFLDRDKIKE